MRILSIDVGVKNLAFCVVQDERVVDWRVESVLDAGVNSKKLALEVLIERLLSKLMEEFGGDLANVIDLVLIENQPANKNRTMKSVSIAIYTFFNMLKLAHGTVRKIRFVSAKLKLRCNLVSDSVSGPVAVGAKRGGAASAAAYRDRKAAAVRIAREHYVPLLCDADMCRAFDAAKKKDDLADCLLQCVYYMENFFSWNKKASQ